MKKPSYLTISIDDGHPADFKSADLLAKYELKATFYIPAHNPEREVMAPDRVRELSKSFEIGAHTFNHARLRHLTDESAWNEITEGKKWLEDVTGVKAVAFCYPGGKLNRRTPRLVEKAGFLGGRTCWFNRNDWPADPFLWGLSTHAYSHSPWFQMRHAAVEANVKGAVNFFRVHGGTSDWECHFLRAMDWVAMRGGIAHLFYHSWEIEDLGQWEKLARLLDRVSRYKGFERVTNGRLFQIFSEAEGRA